MKHTFLTVLIASAAVFATSVHAASITNNDTEQSVLTVTEKGVRTEVAVAPNSKVTTCNDGCFVTFPSGDLLILKGAEEVVIEGGKGRIIKN